MTQAASDHNGNNKNLHLSRSGPLVVPLWLARLCTYQSWLCSVSCCRIWSRVEHVTGQHVERSGPRRFQVRSAEVVGM